MEQSPWETNCLSANWGISCTIWYVKFCHHMYKSQPLHRVLCQIRLVHTFQSCCLKIHFNFLFLLCLGIPNDLFPSGFPAQNLYALLFLIHVTCPAHLILLDIWWAVQIMKLLTVPSHPVLYYLIPLSPKYLPQYPILKHSQPIFCAKCDRPRYTPV